VRDVARVELEAHRLQHCQPLDGKPASVLREPVAGSNAVKRTAGDPKMLAERSRVPARHERPIA